MNWAEAEMATADLGDERLNRRLAAVLKRLGDDPAASIPVACRGRWAEVQGAYRLLEHENVTWEAVLEPHWACTQERSTPIRWCCVSAVHHGIGFYHQPSIDGLGPLSYAAQHGGLYAHPTLAVTPEGLSLGVLDAWLWARVALSHGQDKRHSSIED